MVTVLGVVVTVFTALSVRSQKRHEYALEDLREVAETMQRVLLRPVSRWIGGIRTEARYLAAAAYARVRGDLSVIIGDVMGKGLATVKRAADVVGALLARFGPSGESREFVTAPLVGLPDAEDSDGERATAELVCCGHPPPLLLRQGQATFIEARSPAPPLGIMRLADGWCRSRTLPFHDGDRLLFYTNGVSEARDAQERFYPLAERVVALFHEDLHAHLAALEPDLLQHAGGQLDDDAALLLARPERLPADPRHRPQPHRCSPKPSAP